MVMADVYVVDTSSLIDIEVAYPRKDHPEVWGQFDLLIDEGRLKAPHAVYKEISPANAPLHSWAKEKAVCGRKAESRTRAIVRFFVPDNTVARLAAEIMGEHGHLVHPYSDTAADPYIIALARTINGDLSDSTAVIVTEEKDRVNKIPHVARTYGIRTVDMARFLREIGF